MFKKVSVIGLGYIGLPTAAMFASRKVEVTGVDVNANTVSVINQGKIHIVEPDLDVAVQSAVNQGYLRATQSPEPADVFIVAVPTPFKDDHKPDLSYIESASKAIAKVLAPGNLVILESTSPVGTTEKMADWLAIDRPDLSFPQQVGEAADIQIAHCPERVLPGHVMRELIENDRIIGGMTKKAAQLSSELYKIFVTGECILTNSRTAEMSKLVENSFRDVNIAFANELSMICEEQNIDVRELISLANRHPRVNILNPGCGVGGHCIAVDPWFIVDSNPEHAKLIKQARETNDYKPTWVTEEVIKTCQHNNTRSVVCLGISFKPNIDDLRESPAIGIVEKLIEEDYQVFVVEPNIENLPESLQQQGAKLIAFDEIGEEKVVVALVAHDSFYSSLRSYEINPVLDFCGVLNNKAKL